LVSWRVIEKAIPMTVAEFFWPLPPRRADLGDRLSTALSVTTLN
jgi:hypothetical protein